MLSDGIDDFEPIASNHILLGRPSPNYQPCVTNVEDINLRKRWREVQAATDMFWHRWLKEYVPLLTARKKWNVKSRNFQVEDQVLVSQTCVSLSIWPFQNFKSQNNGVTVRVSKVKTHSEVYVRPTASL